MKRGMAPMILALVIVGCGSGVLDPAATRTTPSEARASCRTAGLRDDAIDVLFLSIRADRDHGFTFEQELSVVGPTCQESCVFDSICAANCTVCGSLVVAAVFGR